MPKHIYKALEELSEKIKKMKGEAECIANKLQNAALDQDTYRSEEQLQSEDDYDIVENIQSASEMMYQVANDLQDITSNIETTLKTI